MRDESRGWNFLVDCGMQQGERTAADWNACDWPFGPRKLKFDARAHLPLPSDPDALQKSFRGLVYCTNETAAIARILLRDAAELSDIGFTGADVDPIRCHELLGAPLFGRFHPVDQDLFVRFFRSGHVVGALSVTVHCGAPRPGQRRFAPGTSRAGEKARIFSQESTRTWSSARAHRLTE